MQWYYAIDGQRLGPVPHAELERLLQSGALRGDALLWRQGMDQWKTLAEVKERDPGMFAAEGPPPLPEPPVALPEEKTPDIARREPSFPASVDATAATSDALVYAGFWQRAAAFVVDAIIWLFGLQILSNIVVLLAFPEMVQMTEAIAAAGGSMAFKPTPEQMVVLVQFTALVMVVGVIWAVVYDVFFLRRFSATPGKMLCGLRVVQSDGEPLGVGRIVVRTLAKGIVGGPTLGIGYLIAAFDEQKRGLHDFFCSTRVVKKR